MSAREWREHVEGIWLLRLRDAEQRYRDALAETRRLQAGYDSMPSSDGNLALTKALKAQSAAMDEYAQVLQTVTRLVVSGEAPGPEPTPASRQGAEPATDLEIQEWVFGQYGFAPHPSWIAHCRELYLGELRKAHSQQCPPERRMAIKQAFAALGLLRE